MEVVASPSSNGPPFHDHDVREWSRLDSLTGVLERARLETDHWTANTSNSRHQYGKVVDSRARTNADGALQQQARRQLEVFHSQIPGGRLKVVKTQTVSSSRWSHKSDQTKDFENLHLTLNPLDLTSEKSKAIVGRSVGRRPPSRQRPKDEPSLNPLLAPSAHHRVSRLCHQLHESAIRKHLAPPEPRENGDGVEIHEIESTTSSNSSFEPKPRPLTRKKSTSSEELDKATKSSEDLEDLEELQNWRRTSKLRRSLQYPNKSAAPTPAKPADLPDNIGNVRKIREELEKGRRLSTALRGNQVDLEALDQILKSISNSSIEEAPDEEGGRQPQKRNSFVTVETLQQVKGRLRSTKDEEDDGIVTEDPPEPGRVRSYVFGMEKKPIVGTGSLESRTKLLNGANNLRSEDWYNRRKSYGFEQVHNQADSLKTRIESSTDSGIYRSSEIAIPATASVKEISSIFNQKSNAKSTTITIPIHSWDDSVPEKENKRHSIAVDESKYVNNGNNNDNYRRTSLIINPVDRKSKKVEFCKTEVHFGEGRVNIVETDEKPPPTNNFRRRRRNSGPIDEMAYDHTLPMLHFGDSTYEKELLGVEDEPSGATPCSIVTVNTNLNLYRQREDETEDEKKERIESVKGILKNKPIKPIPYHLGEEPYQNGSDSDSGKWGVKLKPVHSETPFWKSTVTLHNTIYSNKGSDPEPEFKNLLKKLRPVNGTTPTKPDLLNRRSWCEDTHWTENKVYSTKVNFGDGGTTVVENDFDANKERVWTQQQKDSDRVTTTTKITIDLSPSPTESKTPPLLVPYCNGASAANSTINSKRSHSFKSTSLILDTINRTESRARMPQLEALKKLYDAVHSDDSDADKEVQSLMGRMEDRGRDEDNTSEVSGSWSRVTAFRAVKECLNHNSTKIDKGIDLHEPEMVPTKLSPIPKAKTLKSNKPTLHSPSLVTRSNDFTTGPPTNEPLHQKHEQVLRQPKKSEMTYFGVNVKPKPPVITKPVCNLSEKPDLLQHMKPKLSTPPTSEPIYENVKRKGRDFDAKILEELTKAADEILQAVNGFSDGDEQPVKESKPLDTIAESKSWSQTNKSTKSVVGTRAKLKTTSSNSSVESVSAARRPFRKATSQSNAPPRRPTEAVSKSSVTKARRLQRASSREALLQSHGSSSEDLGSIKVAPPRKPRQVKKTKTMQLTVTNGLDLVKKETPRRIKREETTKKPEPRRIEPVEIRHKTAVSTIRSTAEKSSRERSTTRSGDAKKRMQYHRESTKSLASGRDVKKSIGSKEVSNHRIATANIKKCHRSEGGTNRQ